MVTCTLTHTFMSVMVTCTITHTFMSIMVTYTHPHIHVNHGEMYNNPLIRANHKMTKLLQCNKKKNGGKKSALHKYKPDTDTVKATSWEAPPSLPDNWLTCG